MMRELRQKRWLCGMLSLLMLLAVLTPLPAARATATARYGVVLLDKVLFRKAITGSDFWARLDRGWVAEILGEETVDATKWYKAKATLPHDLKNSFTGYLRGDVFRPMTAEEQAAWLANPQQGAGLLQPTLPQTPADDPPATASNLALVTMAGAALRQTPSPTSVTIVGFLLNTVITILEAPVDTVNGWYKASGGGYIGYISASQIRLISAEEAAGYQGGTQQPQQPSAPVTGASGYAVITQVRTNLRKTPAGASLLQLDINVRLPYFGAPLAKDGYNWLYVQDSKTGVYGYVRSDCYRIEGEQPPAVPDAPAPQQPDPAPQLPAQGGYVKLTKDGVNLRKTPGGDSQMQMAINSILPYYGNPSSSLGYSWVYVRHASGAYGYVRSDCYTFVDAEGKPVAAPTVPAPPITPPVQPPVQPEAPGATSGYVKLIRGGVNLRQSPGGLTFARLDAGTVLPYFGFAQQGGYTWYYVLSAKGAGYIRSDMAELTEGGGLPPPVVSPEQPTGQVLGYVVTTHSGVNLRQNPSSAAPIYKQLDRGTVWPLISSVVNREGYNWYFVRADGRTGYLRGDVVRQLSADEVTAYLAGTLPGETPTQPTTPDTPSGHIITTMDAVNIRVSPSLDAGKLGQVAKAGSVFAYETTISSGGRMWYRMIYNGQVAYMLASLARVMTPEEYQLYLAGQPAVTPSPSPAPTVTVAPADQSGTAVTTADRVLIRGAASMSAKTLSILYTKGSTLRLLSNTPYAAEGYSWYQALAGGVQGFVRGDFIRILSKEEEAKLNQTGNPDAPMEASYPTLSRGASGEAVTRLQAELSRLNFLPPSAVTGVYTTETADAVRNYQRASGLFVDGIAGPNTQHKLYGTVPVGSYTPPSTGTSTLYPVEKVDWYTGDIQSVWRNGTVATVTDVSTKLSFQAKRWAGAYHADVEPLTSADTAIMCRIYGVKTAQEIADKNLWQRRPVWVTVGGRSFAASIYGVPHNYPQGDTIADNDFSGQFCVHFINSKTHSTLRVDAQHMNAINTAYNSAPERK